MKDICCIGHVTLDKIITPDHTFYQNGGTAYYFAYGINHLPHDVSFQMVTAIAQKDREAISRMEAEGIDVVAFDSKETVFFENKYGNNRNARSQRVLAKSDPFTVEQMEGLEARVFHLGSLLSDDFSPEVVECLSRKGKVSIDVQGYLREVRDEHVYACDWKDKMEVLAMTDILKLNEYEMEVITGEKDPRRVARIIASWGVKEVVLTFGSYGSQIYYGGKFYDIPAYEPQHCIDVTGCGDTFSTGYLYCRAKGLDCEEAGKFAAAMCTLKIEKPGPFSEDISRIERIIRLGANI
jgi:sugar/nucleoside kinase (ribokinase family)